MNKEIVRSNMNSHFIHTDKLILALDGMSKLEAFSLIEKLPHLQWVKVGLELFVSNGPKVIDELHDMGLKVFLDLKFHDIPTTVENACREAAKTGAELITVHTCAGSKALKLASSSVIEASKESFVKPPTLLGVTVLTSWNSEDLKKDLLIEQTLIERVNFLAKIAVESGLGGCVCSPLELKALRKICPENFQLITPGIRLIKNDLGDQERVMTPYEAFKSGTSKIVVGRPITKDDEPVKSFEKFLIEIDRAYLE